MVAAKTGTKRAPSPTGAAAPPRKLASAAHRDSKCAFARHAATAHSGRSAAAAEDSDGGPGEFEDPWEDDYESDNLGSDVGELPTGGDDEADEELVRAGEGVSGMDIDDEDEGDAEPDSMAYLPGLGQGRVELDEDEELVPDLTSYVVLHHARLQWPCLSFDVLRDVRPRRPRPH